MSESGLPSLTIFTTAPDFVGHRGTIQRNALRSWKLLGASRILLIGKSQGAGELASELGVQRIEEVATTPAGTPKIDSLFSIAVEAQESPGPMAYVNSDIILTTDLIQAVARIHFPSFLLIGRRWDLRVERELDFSPGWEEKIKLLARKHGRPGPPTAVDYFVFNALSWGEIPPFAIGRGGWDNYLVHRVKQLGLPVIDGSQVVTAVHQTHEPFPRRELEWGANLGLFTDPSQVADIRDASFRLKRNTIRRTYLREQRRKARGLLRTKAPAVHRVASRAIALLAGRG